MIEQTPYGTAEVPFGPDSFAENPEPRCPCVLLLDTSGSMAGARIGELTAGLQAYRDALAADPLAAKRVETAVITLGGEARVASHFVTMDAFRPPALTAGGETPLGAAVVLGVNLLRQRKEVYRAHGVSYFRPWLFLITDGGPTDPWREAAALVKEGEAAKAFLFFAVGVAEANVDVLRQLSVRDPLMLNGLEFRKLFLWLSQSQAAVSRSTPGDAIPLPNPTGPAGWATTA